MNAANGPDQLRGDIPVESTPPDQLRGDIPVELTPPYGGTGNLAVICLFYFVSESRGRCFLKKK